MKKTITFITLFILNSQLALADLSPDPSFYSNSSATDKNQIIIFLLVLVLIVFIGIGIYFYKKNFKS